MIIVVLVLILIWRCVQGSVGILNVVQLFYAMAVCGFILTKTVIMATMNDVINYLLLIPVAGCLLMGYVRLLGLRFWIGCKREWCVI